MSVDLSSGSSILFFFYFRASVLQGRGQNMATPIKVPLRNSTWATAVAYSERNNPDVDLSFIVELDGDSGFVCSDCTRMYGNNDTTRNWTGANPCKHSKPSDAIKSHYKSTAHGNAAAARVQPPLKVDNLFQAARQREHEALLKRFRTIWVICFNSIALWDYGDLLELEQINGAYDTCKDVLTGSHSSYTSHQFVNEVIQAIADVIRWNKLHVAQKSPVCFGDSSPYLRLSGFWSHSRRNNRCDNIQPACDQLQVHRPFQRRILQLLCWYRHIQAVLAQLDSTSVWVGLQRLPAGDSATLAAALQHQVKVDSLQQQRCASLGTDGASAMIGRKSGLQARLLAQSPIAVGFHCAAHRLPLAAKDAAEGCKYLKTVFELIGDVGRAMQASSKRISTFESIQHDRGKQFTH